MEFSQYYIIILIGFMVWLVIAPRIGNPGFTERFLAYMVTLMLCLIGTSELILTRPSAFFFSVGGGLAFIYLTARTIMKVINAKS